jgi:hypothetical protein
MARSGGFAFIDEGEALRALDIDRDTLLSFVREKRLRAYPGVGKGNFFRMSDVQALARELGGAEEAAEAETTNEATTPAKGKLFDPAYKVHVRLLADLKWYDLSDDDLRAWTREMTADGYTRQRANITMVMERLQRLLTLMDETAESWREIKPAATPAARRDLPMITPAKPRRELPMAAQVPAPEAAPRQPTLPPARRKKAAAPTE